MVEKSKGILHISSRSMVLALLVMRSTTGEPGTSFVFVQIQVEAYILTLHLSAFMIPILP